MWKKVSNAISAFDAGVIDVVTYLSQLQTALSNLRACDKQVNAKAGKSKGINEPELTQIRYASSAIHEIIDGLIVAAGG